jgi:hypothetical protein
MLDFLKSYLLPLIGGGAVGSLVTPWVQWTIEKRRLQVDYRRAAIKRWRMTVQSYDAQKWWDDGERPFGSTQTYAEMREHLKPYLKASLEGRTIIVGAEGRGENGIRTGILDTITRVEKKVGALVRATQAPALAVN